MKICRVNEEAFKEFDLDSQMILKGFEHAKGLVACGAPENTDEPGREFVISVVIPEELESGDKRKFNKGSLSVIQDFPIPLMWQPALDSRPSDSRAAKRTEKPPLWGDPLRRLNRHSRNGWVKGCGP